MSDPSEEQFFVNHVHFVLNHMVKDESSTTLRGKTFYIHHFGYATHTARTSKDVVASKEQLKHLIERAMGGTVVATQALAKYVICDDKEAIPKPKPLKHGQCLVRTEYVFNRFFNPNVGSDLYESLHSESQPFAVEKKHKYRLKIDNSRFCQSDVPFDWIEELSLKYSVKSSVYGPLSLVESSTGSHNDLPSLFGPVSRVKRYIDCFIEHTISRLLEEGSFAQTHARNTPLPMVVIIQVNSKLHNKVVTKRHRQMLEMVGDVMLAAANNISSIHRSCTAGILMNGLEVQYAVMQRMGASYDLTVSNVLTIGSFQQRNTALTPYGSEFYAHESDLLIITGIFKSMLTSPTFFKPLVHEVRELSSMDTTHEYNRPSPKSAIKVVRDIQEKRSPQVARHPMSSPLKFPLSQHPDVFSQQDEDSKSYIAKNLEALQEFFMESQQ